MNQNEQKKIWQEEADQLKSDLQSRPKIIQKREVPIRMTSQRKKNAATPQEKTVSQDNPLWRQMLGL